MFRRAPVLILLLLFAAAPPAAGAGPHIEPGTLVADGAPDQGALVLLSVHSGFKDAQSVYVVRPVARCRDPSGPGWYAPRLTHELRSAPDLEGRERLGTLDPSALPNACANPVPAPQPPAQATAWARFVDGTLDPFGPVTFPPFDPPSAARAPDSGSDDGVQRLVNDSFRPAVAGA